MIVDSQGFIYVTGYTNSSDLPVSTTLGNPPPPGSGPVINTPYVAKLDPDAAPGQGLEWLTYFGGSGLEMGLALALHPNEGTVYVGGFTPSTDFPTFNGGTGGPLLTHHGNGRSGFVMALDTLTGGNLVYSVLLGGSVSSLTVDTLGNAWCCGSQSSVFPNSVGGDPNTRIHGPLGAVDAMVALLNPTGTSVLASALIGGPEFDSASNLVTDGSGHVYVVGVSGRDVSVTTGLFPTTTNQLKAPINPPGGGYASGTIDTDGFLLRLDLTLAELQYSTLVGGSSSAHNGGGGTDRLWGVTIHETGNEESVVLVGVTETSNFPLANPLLDSSIGLRGAENSGNEDGCICVLDFATFSPSPQQDPTLRLSSYIGGWGDDGASDVEVDGAGNIHLFGWCLGLPQNGNPTKAKNFPQIGSPSLQSGGDYSDTFLAILTPGGGAYSMPYCSRAGGNSIDFDIGRTTQGLALGPANTVHLGFDTKSSDLFLSANAVQSSVIVRMVYVRRLASPLGPPQPGIVVDPTAGLVTTEGGGTDSFSVLLATQPVALVTIDVSTGDATEGIVSAGAQGPGPLVTLSFDATNWDQPQTVSVHGVDDALQDGNVAYTLVNAPAVSADFDYAGLDADDVSATNLDDDQPQVIVSQITPSSMDTGTTVAVVILGSGFAPGASVTLENGAGPTPTVSDVVVNSGTITAMISTSNGGPPGVRVWDVRVTNPDSSTDVLEDGFTVVK